MLHSYDQKMKIKSFFCSNIQNIGISKIPLGSGFFFFFSQISILIPFSSNLPHRKWRPNKDLNRLWNMNI
ncbi:hypothetical protein Hanom_Chr12g01128661 [Helianthus anomalus]